MDHPKLYPVATIAVTPCQDAAQLMAGLTASGRLPSGERQRLAAHLETCSDCRTIARPLGIDDELEPVDQLRPSDDLRRRVMTAVYADAAAHAGGTRHGSAFGHQWQVVRSGCGATPILTVGAVVILAAAVDAAAGTRSS